MAFLSNIIEYYELGEIVYELKHGHDGFYIVLPPILRGTICSGMDEDETGWHGYVSVEPNTERGQIAYVDHYFSFPRTRIKMRESYGKKPVWYINGQRFKFDIEGCDVDGRIDELCNLFLTGKHVNATEVEALIYNLLYSHIKPFDFETYFISQWDPDAYSENIPYGNVGLLHIDGCVFLLDDDIENITEENIRLHLKEVGWKEERIERLISKHDYVISDDFDIDIKVTFIDG